jgi:2-aminoethylphosphonate-pyruvate transaminase
MTDMGFIPLLPEPLQSPIITAFQSPKSPQYQFKNFYAALKSHGFVIYPGKVTEHDTFRIGNIGHVTPEGIVRLLDAVKLSITW